MLEFFPYRLYSYQFPFRKPDRRIFEAAIAKVGERAENILFVGDRIYTDIKPALKAGMRAALKSAYTNKDKEVPDGVWRIELISELPMIIEKVNAEIVTRGPWPVTRFSSDGSRDTSDKVKEVLNG